MSIAQIAGERGLSTNTVQTHLLEAMRSGERIDIARLVSAEKRAAITTAIETHGDTPLTPVMEALGEGYTYAELRFVKAALGRDAVP